MGVETPLVKGSVDTDEAIPKATGCWLALGSGFTVVLSGFKTLCKIEVLVTFGLLFPCAIKDEF